MNAAKITPGMYKKSVRMMDAIHTRGFFDDTMQASGGKRQNK
jgi:hypothetical protein